jgi:hypothetical protein
VQSPLSTLCLAERGGAVYKFDWVLHLTLGPRVIVADSRAACDACTVIQHSTAGSFIQMPLER